MFDIVKMILVSILFVISMWHIAWTDTPQTLAQNSLDKFRNHDHIIKVSEQSILTANYRIVIDEMVTSLKDNSGNNVKPFSYNDSIYVPFRAIAQAFGINVEWNANNYSIILTGGGGVPDKSEWRAYNGYEKVFAEKWEMVTFESGDIAIFIDGERVALRDASGNVVSPIIYNDSTYIPIRAVAQALDKEVSWDGSAVLISGNELVSNLKNQCTPLINFDGFISSSSHVMPSFNAFNNYNAFDNIMITFSKKMNAESLYQSTRLFIDNKDITDQFAFDYDMDTNVFTISATEGPIYFSGDKARVTLVLGNQIQDEAGNKEKKGRYIEFDAIAK